MKSPTAPILGAAVLLALLLVLLGLRLGGRGLESGGSVTGSPELARVDPVGAETDRDSDLVEIPVSEGRREDVGSEGDGATEDAPDSPRFDPEIVRVRFVDADTGEDLDDVEVRGATHDRFVSKRVSSPAEIALSLGTWTIAARVAPFEVVEIEPFEVERGETVDLGTVELRRGWGSITSAVDVPESVAASGPFGVHLYGEGRSTCTEHRCGSKERCGHCGYDGDATHRSVQAMELFQFDGLAAGEYRLLVFDAKKRILFNEHVVLATGQAVRLDLRMEVLDVEFDITGPDGEPFIGRWREEGVTYEGPVEFYFRSGDDACASARTSASSARVFVRNTDGSHTVHRRTDRVFLRDPEVIARERNARAVIERAHVSAVRDLRLELSAEEMRLILRSTERGPSTLDDSAPPARAPDDRPRQENDEPTFEPWSASPTIETRPLAAKRIGRGRYRVHQVPMHADGVLVTSGPFFISTEVDLLRWSGTPIEIEFVSRCNASSKLFTGSKSCFDCHGEAGVAQMAW